MDSTALRQFIKCTSLSLSLSLSIYIYIYIYILDEIDGLKITAIKIVFFGFWVKGMDGK